MDNPRLIGPRACRSSLGGKCGFKPRRDLRAFKVILHARSGRAVSFENFSWPFESGGICGQLREPLEDIDEIGIAMGGGSTSLESHFLARPLVFSTVPFCQANCGSQNHVCVLVVCSL